MEDLPACAGSFVASCLLEKLYAAFILDILQMADQMNLHMFYVMDMSGKPLLAEVICSLYYALWGRENFHR